MFYVGAHHSITKKQKMSSIALRNMKTLTRKEAYYTPSKVETNTAYKLNEKKALMKKIDAGKRDLDVEIEVKTGKILLIISAFLVKQYINRTTGTIKSL
jgi:hypothetical protein